jgi:predicted small lipoprotein YifL
MIKRNGQCAVVSGHQFKRCIVFVILLTAYCTLFTVVTACGKKAPPKPPAEHVSQ